MRYQQHSVTIRYSIAAHTSELTNRNLPEHDDDERRQTRTHARTHATHIHTEKDNQDHRRSGRTCTAVGDNKTASSTTPHQRPPTATTTTTATKSQHDRLSWIHRYRQNINATEVTGKTAFEDQRRASTIIRAQHASVRRFYTAAQTAKRPPLP